MVALHYLKYQHDLSDEDVVALWVENPYWQQFSGMRHFQHQVAIDPSSMTRRRKRLGDAGAEDGHRKHDGDGRNVAPQSNQASAI